MATVKWNDPRFPVLTEHDNACPFWFFLVFLSFLVVGGLVFWLFGIHDQFGTTPRRWAICRSRRSRVQSTCVWLAAAQSRCMSISPSPFP